MVKLGTYSARNGKAGFFGSSTFKLQKVFPVPGIEVLLKKGFDPFQPNIEIVDTPRHANVLLMCGPLTETAEKAATVVFAQMPRPRMLVSLDMEKTHFLPKPDAAINTEDLKNLAKALPAAVIYAENATAFEPAFLIEALSEDEGKGGHHHHGSHEHHEEQHGHHHGDGHHKNKANHGHEHENPEDRQGHQEHEGHHGHEAHHDHKEQKHKDQGQDHGEHHPGSHEHHEDEGNGGRHHRDGGHHENKAHYGHEHENPEDRQGHQGHEGHHGHEAHHDHKEQKHKDQGQDHGEHHHGSHEHHGDEGKGGHHHSHEHHGHHHRDRGHHENKAHPGHEHEAHHDHKEHEEHAHSGHPHKAIEHDHGSGHDHEGDDHGGGGFMSMVMMTKDQPRGTDGLQMDRNQVRFGPFHPGLPGGLQVKMTLAGDTVAQAEVENGLFDTHAFQDFPEEPKDFPGWLAGFDPFQTETYRQLASLTLARATGGNFPLDIKKLEQERVQNLLLWLLKFQKILGDREMERQVFQLWQDFQQKRLSPEKFASFRKKIEHRWYLKPRLQYLGRLPDKILQHFSGPLAKAAGNASDARESLNEYGNFKSFQLKENNVWGWLLTRLEEIHQSLQILVEVTSTEKKDELNEMHKLNFSGIQNTCVKLETSRGTMVLKLEMKDGKIKKMDLKQPSIALAEAVPQLVKNHELADALTAIAALDISPWEISV
ncbi:Ni,Fe-hydrogenase III large subunit [Gillisia sp. Hel_I_86]|nr:Ni,Fe-hydrogenase III large subunit [Gillisia sp. Hel_I_86]